MDRNNYSLVLIDGSFILTRALFAVTRGKSPEEVGPGDIMKLNLQTINKLARDWSISGCKVIVIWDKWGEEYNGYIRSYLLKDHLKYKGSRKYITEDDLKSLTGKELEKAEKEYKLNLLKVATKEAMINEFPKLGIGTYLYPGYEFDDIATLASFELVGKTEKPNIIVTKDTDLTYSVSPWCNFFSLPTYGSSPKIITYKEMLETVPKELRDKGLGLYQYGAMMNAAGFLGHNDMTPTKKKGVNSVKTLSDIMDGDYSGIKNPELFNLQYQTYDVSKFPHYEEVRNDILSFMTEGKMGNIEEFRRVCKEYGITDISDSYYLGLITRFDEKYFSEL